MLAAARPVDLMDSMRDRRAKAMQTGSSPDRRSVKPCRTAEQLHELVQAQIQSLQAEGTSMRAPLGKSAIELGMPYDRPVDVLGRNWNIAEVRGLPLQHQATVRLLIDRFREAFDLAD